MIKIKIKQDIDIYGDEDEDEEEGGCQPMPNDVSSRSVERSRSGSRFQQFHFIQRRPIRQMIYFYFLLVGGSWWLVVE